MSKLFRFVPHENAAHPYSIILLHPASHVLVAGKRPAKHVEMKETLEAESGVSIYSRNDLIQAAVSPNEPSVTIIPPLHRPYLLPEELREICRTFNHPKRRNYEVISSQRFGQLGKLDNLARKIPFGLRKRLNEVRREWEKNKKI